MKFLSKLKEQVRLIRIIHIIGVIALIGGILDPLEGSIVISVGSVLLSLTTYL